MQSSPVLELTQSRIKTLELAGKMLAVQDKNLRLSLSEVRLSQAKKEEKKKKA